MTDPWRRIVLTAGGPKKVLHLEVRFEKGLLEVRPVGCSDGIPQSTVVRHVETLVATVRKCIACPDASVEDCLGPTPHDLDETWGWNHALPPTYDAGMHDIVDERARLCPGKTAISSWDGDLTYAHVSGYSAALARSLGDAGVTPGDYVPVCFEKSRWTVIAVLAVMKAGATFVLMDPTLPVARLQNMAKQVGAKTVVSSCDQQGLSRSILPHGKLVAVGAHLFDDDERRDPTPPSPAPVIEHKFRAEGIMYVVFTSGSTGTPKGVQISHRAYTSSAVPRARAVGYEEASRVLDFASYAFDVSIDSMLLTLANGGCLCIPSDEDRLNDINGVIRRMRVNYAGITPSMARILDLDVIASLAALGLGGEAVSARDAARWGQYTRIVIGYGPCECTIGCTVNSSAATGKDYITIGPGNGAVIWLVHPDDHERLVPVGAVGELLVEGPIVGEGYLNDPDKTAAAFVRDPAWLVAGHRGRPGRRGRLYKTGDLGRYAPDGSGEIVFVGRKDTQVKLRGQRVELGEIESQLKAILPSETNVIVEVIVPLASGGQPALVAFVAPQAPPGRGDADEIELAELVGDLRDTLSRANAELAKVLPRYMVPSAYLPVRHIPTLISGKTDRKRLKQFGAAVDLRRLDPLDAAAVADATGAVADDGPRSDLEGPLREAWGLALQVGTETVRPDDNFFVLGGDSLAAMRLVSVCRARSLNLSVTDIFGHPTLSAMGRVVRRSDVARTRTAREPFAMVGGGGIKDVRWDAARECGADPADIQDMYPCTPTQESLFTFSIKSAEAYVAQRVARVPLSVDLDALKKAWETVVAASPILRTRLVQLHDDPGLRQVVLDEAIRWRHAVDLAQYLERDRREKMNLGEPLARYAIVYCARSGQRFLVWTLHHALYDGWSEPIVLEKVQEALHHPEAAVAAAGPSPAADMGDFVQYVGDTDQAAMQEYWRQTLDGAGGAQFPRVPSRDFLPAPDTVVERHIAVETGAGFPFTAATLIRGAWALVASQYTGGDDVLFGETLTGRDVPLPGVEGIVGPLIATVPVRVRVNRTASAAAYLQTVQQEMLARTPYQHMGMQNIRKVSRAAQYACEAPAGLVIQPDTEHAGLELGFARGDPVREAIHFNPYSLLLAFGMHKGGFRVCASFDSRLIEAAQMERVLAQLEAACCRLAGDLSRRLDQISCLPAAELEQIWHWNRIPPLPLDQSLKRLRAGAAVTPGAAYPPPVVPWVCDPRSPTLLSPLGCPGELWLEGAFFPGETVESPAWLVAGCASHAGRTGRAQPTGDIVRLQGDGSLVYVGRKENFVPGAGGRVDAAELEAHLEKYLPLTRAVAVGFRRAPGGGPQRQTPEDLAVVVEQPPGDETDRVAILSVKHTVTCELPDGQGTAALFLPATVPVGLAAGLKGLDKHIRNSLASHLLPSLYVVVDKMPINMGHVDRGLLSRLVAGIPQGLSDEIRDGLAAAWKTGIPGSAMTAAETILRAAWAQTLRIAPHEVDVDDNFFRMGGDSVLAMRLVSHLRSQGHGLTVADVFQHMRLGDAAKVLKLHRSSAETMTLPYAPFSLLGLSDTESFLAGAVRPKLSRPSWLVQDVYPVTDAQALDVRATVDGPRTSMQYTMLYFSHDGVDLPRLSRACSELVAAHDILRTVFVDHDQTLLQVVVKELAAPVTRYVADDDNLKAFVDGLCATHIESPFPLGSSFLQFFLVEGQAGQACLVIGLSHALYDGVSLPRLLRDLETLYSGRPLAAYQPFSSYLSRTRDERVRSQAQHYWGALLEGSQLSILDRPPASPKVKAVFKSQVAGAVPPPSDITTASLLTAAWAVVLARRLGAADVTFGSVTSGRGVDLAGVEDVVGPCYQFAPVRVAFRPGATNAELLRSVQTQRAASSAHDFLGFEAIARAQGPQWTAAAPFFDSIVHHQDWDDFDTMPFAGGSCRVEILNPHGDAPHPLKAVSFVRDGQLHVGVVGSEAGEGFVDSILGELAAAVQELLGG